jgi:hypothetical protein
MWETGPHRHSVQGGKLGPSGDVGLWEAVPIEDPLQPRLRVLSPKERALLDLALDKWLLQGYIEPSRAWVTCNPLFVEKHDGSMRTCIDYRPINRVIPIWEWPLPRIKDVRHRLGGTKWYTRLDLKDAFHRIRIPAEYRALTAFHTHRGKYQFTRMPFGLSTAPATYQRFIEWVVAPCMGYIICYVDDILVMSKTKEGLRKKEALVRATLRKASVEINEKKSESCVQEVNFVGLRIKAGTIGVALPVGTQPLPRTREEWWSALGYANCFRDFLTRYADRVAGLYPGANQLPEPERTDKWKLLWNDLTQSITLESYDDGEPGQLYLDASKYAVGAVLCQKGKVCAVYSKSLNSSQQNYSATDREHLALMLGVEAFRIFIQSNVTLETRTDHSALLNRNEERMTGRQLRWKTRILEITSNISHVAGKENPADFWSRQGWKWGGDRFSA